MHGGAVLERSVRAYGVVGATRASRSRVKKQNLSRGTAEIAGVGWLGRSGGDRESAERFYREIPAVKIPAFKSSDFWDSELDNLA